MNCPRPPLYQESRSGTIRKGLKEIKIIYILGSLSVVPEYQFSFRRCPQSQSGEKFKQGLKIFSTTQDILRYTDTTNEDSMGSYFPIHSICTNIACLIPPIFCGITETVAHFGDRLWVFRPARSKFCHSTVSSRFIVRNSEYQNKSKTLKNWPFSRKSGDLWKKGIQLH